MDNARLAEELAHARRDIADLHRRLAQAEAVGSRPIPNTMLLDESFLKRALAVFGHSTVASLIVLIPFYALIFFLLLALGEL